MATIGELMLLWDIRDELKRANDIVEEERVRREWEKWDRECKEGVIRRLRQYNEGDNLLTLNRIPIYPNMSQGEQADIIERGELKIVAPCKGMGALGAIWTDNDREEAQNPTYRELFNLLMTKVKQGDFRIVA